MALGTSAGHCPITTCSCTQPRSRSPAQQRPRCQPWHGPPRARGFSGFTVQDEAPGSSASVTAPLAVLRTDPDVPNSHSPPGNGEIWAQGLARAAGSLGLPWRDRGAQGCCSPARLRAGAECGGSLEPQGGEAQHSRGAVSPQGAPPGPCPRPRALRGQAQRAQVVPICSGSDHPSLFTLTAHLLLLSPATRVVVMKSLYLHKVIVHVIKKKKLY